MRTAFAITAVGVLAALAIRLHRCSCGSHRRNRRRVGEVTFFPTTYGGFFSQTEEESCAGCGKHIGLNPVTWNRFSPETVALFI